MAVVQSQIDEEQRQPSSLLMLFSTASKVPDGDLFALITDFFNWLENDWRLPTYSSETMRHPLPHPIALIEGQYTMRDLASLYGRSIHSVHQFLWNYHIVPFDYQPTGKGGQKYALYRKQDLTVVIDRWEWERLMRTVDDRWLRFFPPACGTCLRCRDHVSSPMTQQIYCSSGTPLYRLRSSFARFLEEVNRLGSVLTWWHTHRTDSWNDRWCAAWGILFIYLLDRRLLHLANDELVHLEPLHRRNYQDLSRLWRHRCPDEYERFLQALSAANYNTWTRDQSLAIFGLLILLKYGISSILELGGLLSREQIQQVCREHRLVTMSLGLGIFLPYPLSAAICIGHVALDDIRYYFWSDAAHREQPKGKQSWDRGPRYWRQMTVSAMEQALAAPIYAGGKSILSRRPETERKLINPWRFSHEGKLADAGYALLSNAIQEVIMSYIVYCHQEQHMALSTLQTHLQAILHFFTWLRKQGELANYPHWKHGHAQEVFRMYASIECAEVQPVTRRDRLRRIAHFFSTLADLEIPAPPGYRLLYTLEKGAESPPRMLPKEEIMDRVFQNGVRQLNYDPFARLALTIQYYCGTRVTETCELHLFCILEDQNGRAYLLIPRGKTKQERPFPIVELGMGPLLEYMDEIVSLRLTPEGTSRLLGKTNFRYANDGCVARN